MRQLMAAMPIAFYLAALCLGYLGIHQPLGSESLSPTLQWMLTLALGVPSLWAAVGHSLDSERVAKSIGWLPSPFQKEIAGANLGLGLGAIVASSGGRGAAWAIFFMAAAFLWSAAAVHVADMRERKNFAINNAGPIFWWDIVTPFTILLLLLFG